MRSLICLLTLTGSLLEGAGTEEDVIAAVSEAHAAIRGLSASAAQYRALQAAAQMHCYGMEFFTVSNECFTKTQVSEINFSSLSSLTTFYL